MVDTLAFLKNDYSEEEIHKILDEINSYVTFFGGYGATLLKTTNAAIYREKKEGFEVPEEIVRSKLSEDMLVIQKKLDDTEAFSVDEFLEFMSSSECNKLMEARGVIIDNYLTEHDGYNITEYEPNKYVINARLNMGAYRKLAELLENMGIEFTDIVQWWGNEFDQNTAFEFIEYESKEIAMNTYNFWLAGTHTDKEVNEIRSNLKKALEHIRFGLYCGYQRAMRVSSDAVVKVPVLDEYRKLVQFKQRTYSELWEKAMASGEPNEKMSSGVKKALEKETTAYCKTHRVFDEREIKKGQIILPIHIVEEDVDAVKTILESIGCSLAFYSVDDYNCMKKIRTKPIH